MGLTAYAQEEKAKREAWHEIGELRKRIAELEADNKTLTRRNIELTEMLDLLGGDD